MSSIAHRAVRALASLAAPTALLLVAPSVGRAQAVSVYGGSTLHGCSTGTTTGAASIGCGGDSKIAGNGSASTQRGQLRAGATVTGSIEDYRGGSVGGSITSTAYWADVLRWSPAAGAARPRYLELDLWFHGGIGLAADGQAASATGGGSYQMGANNYGTLMSHIWTEYAFGSTGENGTRGFADAKTVRLELNTDDYLSFFMDLRVSSAVGAWGPIGPVSMYASSNFMNTAGITALRFYDADGTESSSRVAYAFDNGTELLPAASTVPEPATLALVAGGLAALAVVRRRRAR